MGKQYYTADSGLTAFDVIEQFYLGFNLGNVVKYVLRCGKKGTAADACADLEKAIDYLQRELSRRRSECGSGNG